MTTSRTLHTDGHRIPRLASPSGARSVADDSRSRSARSTSIRAEVGHEVTLPVISRELSRRRGFASTSGCALGAFGGRPTTARCADASPTWARGSGRWPVRTHGSVGPRAAASRPSRLASAPIIPTLSARSTSRPARRARGTPVESICSSMPRGDGSSLHPSGSDGASAQRRAHEARSRRVAELLQADLRWRAPGSVATVRAAGSKHFALGWAGVRPKPISSGWRAPATLPVASRAQRGAARHGTPHAATSPRRRRRNLGGRRRLEGLRDARRAARSLDQNAAPPRRARRPATWTRRWLGPRRARPAQRRSRP